MIAKHQLTLVMGLCLAVAIGGYMAVRGAAQATEAFDYSNAGMAEVHDAQGQVVLRGQFSTTDTDPNDLERKAVLSPTGVVTDASGEAEIEVSGSGVKRRQEIEFEVQNLQPGAVFTFIIDGRGLATVTTDRRGKAEYERAVPLP